MIVGALVSSACGARTALRVRDVASSDATIDARAAQDVIDDSLGDSQSDRDDVSDVTDAIEDRDVFDCRLDPMRACDDRNACTADLCRSDGTCLHSNITCDDEDPCTANQCDPAGVCVFAAIECGGCADGQRDAFLDRARNPDIAGCAGGFALPGLNREAAPTCARIAGDDGPNPTGLGCRSSDLCAEGFHVCRSAGEVRACSRDGCAGAQDGPPKSFWATRQTGPGCLQCATGTAPDCTNRDCRADCANTSHTSHTTYDIFGCGSLGSIPQASCSPLDRSGNNLCSALRAPWRCDDPPMEADVRESEFVVKPGAEAGGVICCRD